MHLFFAGILFFIYICHQNVVFRDMKIICLFLFLLGVGQCWAVSEVPDSVISFEYIQRIHLQEPNQTLQLLDSIEEHHVPGLQPFEIDMLRSMCYEVRGEYLLEERFARKALAQDSIRLVPMRKLRMLAMLLTTLVEQGKNEDAIRFGKQMMELARQLDRPDKEASVYFNLGRMHRNMERRDEALTFYRKGISLIEDTKNVSVMARLSTAYGGMMGIFIDSGNYEEAIKIGKLREALIRRMSKMSGPPAGYIDQQYGYCYSKMAYIFLLAGKKEEAAEYYNRFEQTEMSKSPFGASEIVPYLLEMRRYEEVLRLNTVDMLAYRQGGNGNDTLNYNYSVILDRFAQAYRGLKLYEKADAYQQRLTVLFDSIYSREQASRAHEYATVFRLHEKELQLANTQVEVQKRNFLMGGLCCLLFFLVIFLVIACRNLTITRRKNRIAVKQIEELLAQREELHKVCCGNPEALLDEKGKNQESQPDGTGISDSVSDCADNISMENRRFLRMEYAVVKDKLFLQPDFGRDELISLSNINKNDLPRILRKYANADNVSSYLNRLRVEYAIKLMKEKPNLSFDAIAKEASFNSHSTFYRAFYKVCGMTPAQYMKAFGKENDSPFE